MAFLQGELQDFNQALAQFEEERLPSTPVDHKDHSQSLTSNSLLPTAPMPSASPSEASSQPPEPLVNTTKNESVITAEEGEEKKKTTKPVVPPRPKCLKISPEKVPTKLSPNEQSTLKESSDNITSPFDKLSSLIISLETPPQRRIPVNARQLVLTEE